MTLGVLAALSLAAGSAPGATTGEDADGGITVVLSSDITSLDQARDETLITRNIDGNIYDRLIGYSPRLTLTPMLATSWKQVNPTTWRFNLRKNVKFHDGEPFDANAVKFSLLRTQAPKSVVGYATSNVARVNVRDRYTVDIVTKRPDPMLLKNVAAYLDIVPPKAGARADFGSHPVGTGPYVFDRWVKGQEVALHANPSYWGKKVGIPSVTYKFIPAPATRLSALMSGQADLVMNLSPEDTSVINGRDNVRTEVVPSVNKMLVILDSSVKQLSDPRVRQALNYAVDKNALVKSVLGGDATKSTSTMVTVVPGYSGKLANYYDQNIAKAKQLLSQAGYPNGFSITLSHTDGVFPKDSEVAQTLQANLGAIGVRVKLQAVTYPNMASMLDKKSFGGMALMRYGDVWVDPSSLLTYAIWSKGTAVFTHDPSVDSMINKAVTVFNPQQRTKLYQQIDATVAKKMVPWVYLFDFKNIYGVSDRLVWKATPYVFMDLRGAKLS
jgi:peptide/nickel transport system substrate-binding protein